MLGSVNYDPLSCTTVLRAIPRASQYSALCIVYLLFSSGMRNTIVTPFKSEVCKEAWSGEESSSKRRSETRTAFYCKLHTCEIVARSPARLNATFDAIIVLTAGDGC
jgi:hypothetical protein